MEKDTCTVPPWERCFDLPLHRRNPIAGGRGFYIRSTSRHTDPKAPFYQQGNLYGTTYSGTTFSGTVFELRMPNQTESGWTFDILHGFTGSPDGAQPSAKLILNKRSNLYSTTQKGGTGTCSFYGCGTVFEVAP